MKALLVLEDGFTLEGEAFCGRGEVFGEVVFNTSLTGYQEIITDPSYKGQIVTLTYPLIGNYGINFDDSESERLQAEALIIREYSPFPHNWRATTTLKEFLESHNTMGIEGIDTRALTRHIREAGAMKGVISTEDLDPLSLVQKARAHPGLVGRDMVQYVTCKESYVWNERLERAQDGGCGGEYDDDGYGAGRFHGAVSTGSRNDDGGEGRRHHKRQYKVVAMDFGIKRNILKMLERAGCHITVVPAYTRAEEILALDPDGIFLSNGPGDPAGLPTIIGEVRKLLGKRPIFGICLGHQLLGLALGFKTYKLKFGHHGGNHPVKNLITGKVEITAQNHGFCVDLSERVTGTPGGVPAPAFNDLKVTHINLNDNTLEGMEVPSLRLLSVQYHPEASPGPHDSWYLFESFTRMMDDFAGERDMKRLSQNRNQDQDMEEKGAKSASSKAGVEV
ncbi:MAG TPA: glutamine-hydrolyzing carbamoyl-phosphate synthase small subunit [Firmicutes bacterium]|nr:glutamine-hydrolyzing carbamoyl-phosphate synthase small subunit [Bacillota bacterium]